MRADGETHGTNRGRSTLLTEVRPVGIGRAGRDVGVTRAERAVDRALGMWHNSPTGTSSAGTSGDTTLATLELWGGSLKGRIVALAGERVTVGSGDSADVVIDDPTVSSLHAILERIGTTWLIRDLGSRNGTKLNGAVVTAQTQLRRDDTVHVGKSRAIYRDGSTTRRAITEALTEPPPNLTTGERRVLVELCRPLLEHNAFQSPTSVNEIAARLFVVRNAVQNHLVNMYDKFGIHADEHTNRRLALANAAIERGAVTRGDLRMSAPNGPDR